ncbi:adrenodoxin-like isoform X2 [Convolutriloba macropyga]|uniref:adrenodoxin-like isoform X2 n=1 Tax=Convolutriloba macropyga TaxID=536237 RepID=UPI003F52735B
MNSLRNNVRRYLAPCVLTTNATQSRFQYRLFSGGKLVSLKFIKERTGEVLTTKAKIGANLYDVVLDNDIDLDGFGACEGTMACVTCHLIFDKKSFDRIKDPASEDELDMLDMALGLSETSRLGCQVHVESWMDGISIKVPADSNDARTM